MEFALKIGDRIRIKSRIRIMVSVGVCIIYKICRGLRGDFYKVGVDKQVFLKILGNHGNGWVQGFLDEGLLERDS